MPSRTTDLEHHLRESYALIREYEAIIQTSSEPKEKARSRRAIEEQWALVEGYLAEYRRLAGDAWPADVTEIAAHFAESGQSAPATPSAPAGGATYNIHIERASGLAIGDGARVVTGGESGTGPPAESIESLRRQLAEAEANLALIRERKSQYVLQVDVPLQLVKEERRLLAHVARLKAKLDNPS
jgi:hypothetical protein